MGADNFTNRGKGTSAAEVFDIITRSARYEHGHGGYTGTIAEKRDFKELTVPKDLTPREFIDRIEAWNDTNETHPDVLRAKRQYEDKWGPALCVKIAEGEWVFFGLASS